jgi:hypothetical protein
MQIIKQVPETHDQRKSFLTDNKAKKNYPGTVNIYSIDTSNLLDTLEGEYGDAITELNRLTAMKVQSKVNTNAFEEVAQITYSQFYRVFNFGIKRLIGPTFTTTLFKESDRAYYGQPVNKSTVPLLNTIARINTFGKKLINGDLNRTNAGGAAMVYPTRAELILVNDGLLNRTKISNSNEAAYMVQLKTIKDLNVKVDQLIKVMMAEADLFFILLKTEAAKRVRLKLWGYYYYTIGSGSDITFTVFDSVTLLPIDIVEGRIDANGDKGISDVTGDMQLHTTIINKAFAKFTKDLYYPLFFPLNISDKSSTHYTIYLVKMLPDDVS